MPVRPWLRASAALLGVSVLLVAASLATRYAAYLAQRRDPGSSPLAVLRLFDVNSERNVPTLWSVGLLLVATGLCLHLAARVPRDDGLRRGWLVLAGLVLALALDEGLALHERLGDAGRALGGDWLHFAWLLPGAAAGAALAALALAALRRHDPLLRRRLVLAGLVYVVGAVVLEAASGVALQADGDRELYVAVTALEELAEMAGLSLLVGALLLSRTGPRAAARLPGQRRLPVLEDRPAVLPAGVPDPLR